MMVSIPEIKNESDTYFMDPKKLRAKFIRIMMFVAPPFISIFIILSVYLLRLPPPPTDSSLIQWLFHHFKYNMKRNAPLANALFSNGNP